MGVGRQASVPIRPRHPFARFVGRELLWLAGSVLLGVLFLLYLHGQLRPWLALLTGLVGGIGLRRLLIPAIARFPGFLRLNFEIGITLLGVLIASWATLALFPVTYWVLKWRPAAALLAAAILLGLALASLLFQQARFEREIAGHRDRVAALREETLRAELKALQAQINPHFLFNALNALAELTQSDPAAAEDLVQDLAHMLRYSLRSSAVPRVTLGQELEAVDRYLRVERARLGDRLRIERDVAAGLGDVPVPGLVFQPLVENAVRHAIATRAEGGTLRIEARREGEFLLLAVTDDGPGLAPALSEAIAGRRAFPAGGGSGEAGGGLANVSERVRLAGGGDLRHEAPPTGGARLELRLPGAAAPAVAVPAARAPEGSGP